MPMRRAHADLLDVGGAAGVDGDDAVALLALEKPFGDPQTSSSVRADGPTASRIALVIQRPAILRCRRAGALVRLWLPRVRQPEIAPDRTAV